MGRRKTIEEFIDESNQKHKFKYDYSQTNYISSFIKVTIICRDHGEFLQTPHDHITVQINGSPRGCPQCANITRGIKTGVSKKLQINDFIKNAQLIHGARYNYESSVYTGMDQLINIQCLIHGEFFQKAHSHCDGRGCPKCGTGNKSKVEKEWLDQQGVLIQHRQHCIRTPNNKRFIVDGYDPLTQTIYEFYGDFWHGNPTRYVKTDKNKILNKTFEELYQKTCDREKILLSLGYNIKTIWESDFNEIMKGHSGN